MPVRCFFLCVSSLFLWGVIFFSSYDSFSGLDKKVSAQEFGEEHGNGATWREPTEQEPDLNSNPERNEGNQIGPKNTRYSYELAKLPSQDGQFWVVYDILPYAERFASLNEPQNSIVNWILFDSGESFWRKEPFCVLSATRERLYVYHNSNVQRYVSNIVDRFLDPTKHNASFSINIVALQAPEWRLRVTQYLTSTAVTIKGNGVDVQGWLVSNDDIAKVMSEVAKRSDYISINEKQSLVPNGATFGWASTSPRKTFSRDYQLDSSFATGYAADVSSVDEGYSIEATPLLSTTGDSLEVGFQYNSTVVEKMKSFSMHVPTPSAPRQQLEIQRPEIVSCDIRGRISIPRSKSAIIDLGMVPLALNKKGNGESNGGLMGSVSNMFSKSAFYDVLLIINTVE